MLLRPGSARPIEAQVLRPMITGCPSVVDLKCRRSSGRCQGMRFPAPITPLAATAAIMDTLGGRAAGVTLLLTLCSVMVGL